VNDTTYTDADAPVDEAAAAADADAKYDRIAEQSVLGSMMLSPEQVDEVMTVVLPGDFWEPKHEIIARAIGSLVAKNEPTDAIAVVEELRRTGKLRQAGGAAYVHELTGIPTSTKNAGYYASTMKDDAVKRRLVAAGIRIQAMGNSGEGVAAELVNLARTEVESVAVGKAGGLKPIGDTFDLLIESLATEPTYIPTPWESLDKLIGGFSAGALTVVAARPGSGKTIACLQIAAKLAHAGMVAFSSLEMTEGELQKRLLAQFGPVSMTSLRTHQILKHEWEKIAEARSRVQGAPIFIDESAGVTLAQIRSHARSVARRGKLTGIVVDYLQLVEGEGQSRQEVVGAVARGLKQLAKDLDVPVIAAAQLKRAQNQRGRQLPTLDDLRESGDIEAAADVVLLLDRDREKHPNDLTVVVAKNRSGEQGKFTLNWEAHYARLRDKTWSPTALIDESEM